MSKKRLTSQNLVGDQEPEAQMGKETLQRRQGRDQARLWSQVSVDHLSFLVQAPSRSPFSFQGYCRMGWRSESIRTRKVDELRRPVAVLFQKCPQGLVLEHLAWSDHLGEQRRGLLARPGWPLTASACSHPAEGQPNREMLLLLWTAAFRPHL